FYRLHWQTRRRLGVPLQPRCFFESLWRRIIEPGFGFVAFAYFGERPIAADLFLAWNGTLIGKFNASDRQFWSLRPNNLVVWAGIEWGCRNGYRLLDFGKTDRHGGGLRNFKMSWGSTSQSGRRARSMLNPITAQDLLVPVAPPRPLVSPAVIKRLFDILSASLALLVALPLLMLLVIAVCVESPGNPFFVQERLGLG